MAAVSLEHVADLLRAAMSPTAEIRSEAERVLEATVRLAGLGVVLATVMQCISIDYLLAADSTDGYPRRLGSVCARYVVRVGCICGGYPSIGPHRSCQCSLCIRALFLTTDATGKPADAVASDCGTVDCI